ncbi:hypothetical protein DFH09DRAFT_1194552 [Mycena vulgaris]|nr:hypothetical protein DFH09DRAFT_1194552 [Mycena vulgaris]
MFRARSPALGRGVALISASERFRRYVAHCLCSRPRLRGGLIPPGGSIADVPTAFPRGFSVGDVDIDVAGARTLCFMSLVFTRTRYISRVVARGCPDRVWTRSFLLWRRYLRRWLLGVRPPRTHFVFFLATRCVEASTLPGSGQRIPRACPLAAVWCTAAISVLRNFFVVRGAHAHCFARRFAAGALILS